MQKKQGISLIVLVITIIVMIILAASVVITLSNTGIINRASQAVQATDLQHIKSLVDIAWAEAYTDENIKSNEQYYNYVKSTLDKNKIDTNEYYVDATEKGAVVGEIHTIGELIEGPQDYGKTVYYEANDVNEWQIYYKDEQNGYVFLISKDSTIKRTTLSSLGTAVPSELTTKQKEVYDIFRLNNTTYELNEEAGNSKAIAYLISGFENYANFAEYGDNIIGAIGAPTLELFSAGYNAYHNITKFEPIVDVEFIDETNNYVYNGEYGYFINSKGNVDVNGLTPDELYVKSNIGYWLSTPSAAWGGQSWMKAWSNYFVTYQDNFPNGLMGPMVRDYSLTSYHVFTAAHDIYPVVCIKSSALVANNGMTTNYTLIKNK